MVPLYSLTNLLSTKFLPYSTYFLLLSSSYAAIAIASYFSLLCHYLAPDKNYASFFSKVEPQPWQNFFPLPLRWLKNCFGGERGCLGTLNCGVKWFNVSLLMIRLVGIDYWYGDEDHEFWGLSVLSCQSLDCSWFCHSSTVWAVLCIFAQSCVWSYMGTLRVSAWEEFLLIASQVLTLNALSATIAMYCLDEFTWQMKDELRPHKPTLKLWCVKIVFAVSMYQNVSLPLTWRSMSGFIWLLSSSY